jgi:hypothetical protein
MTVTSRSNREMLEQFGLLADEDLAALLGLTVKSLQNRPRDRLPEIVKVGRRRFFKEASVREWLGLPEKSPAVAQAAPVRKSRLPIDGVRPALVELRRLESTLDQLMEANRSNDTGRRYLKFASFSVSQAVAALEGAIAD